MGSEKWKKTSFLKCHVLFEWPLRPIIMIGNESLKCFRRWLTIKFSTRNVRSISVIILTLTLMRTISNIFSWLIFPNRLLLLWRLNVKWKLLFVKISKESSILDYLWPSIVTLYSTKALVLSSQNTWPRSSLLKVVTSFMEPPKAFLRLWVIIQVVRVLLHITQRTKTKFENKLL